MTTMVLLFVVKDSADGFYIEPEFGRYSKVSDNRIFQDNGFLGLGSGY